MNPSNEERSQAANWVLWTFDTLGCPELKDSIYIEWKSRFTARLGDARFGREKSVIRFSIPLWERAGNDWKKETAIHEACHIVQRYQESKGERTYRSSPHGAEWKALMRRCGVTPRTRHSVDRTGLRRPRKRQPRTECLCTGCGAEYALTAYRVKRLALYRCPCGDSLRVA